MSDYQDIQWNKLREVLIRYGEYFVQQARANLGKNKSYASGKLGDTMKPIVEITTEHFSVSVEIQSYWTYVEKGRKPGKFPPPGRIMEWIKVKPVRPYKDKRGKLPTVEQLSFLIGRKIAKKGISPRPFFQPAKDATNAYFKEMIDLAIADDVEAFINEQVRIKAYKELMGIL